MGMRDVALSSAITVACALGVSEAKAETVLLNVPHVWQGTTDWCWAAAAHSILKYYGHNELQTCSIVTWSADPSFNSGLDCCGDDYATCSTWGEGDGGMGATSVLANWGLAGELYCKPGVPNLCADVRWLTFDQVKAEIQRGNPIWAAVHQGFDHATVLAGYDDTNDRVYVVDPGKQTPADECDDDQVNSFGAYQQYCVYSLAWFEAHADTYRTTQYVNQSNSTGAVTYNTYGSQHLYSWEVGPQGYLDVNYWWTGPSWTWAKQPLPSPGVYLTGAPKSATYQVGVGGSWGADERDHVYSMGTNGHLWERRYDGTNWAWSDRGTPGVTLGKLGVIAALDESQTGGYDQPRVSVFGTQSGGGSLYRGLWNGSTFTWENHSRPSGVYPNTTPSAISFREFDQQQYYTFVTDNNHLYVNYLNGTWLWGDQSVSPPAPTSVRGAPSAVVYREGFNPMIYVFVLGSNGHLLVNYWAAPFGNGSWQWADLGAPTGTTLDSTVDPVAVTFRENNVQKMYAFARGANGRLYAMRWNGSIWSWVVATGAAPSGTTVASQPLSVLAYPTDSNTNWNIYLFARGQDGRHYTWYDNYGTWNWSGQTSLCKPSGIDCGSGTDCCSGICNSGYCAN